MLSLDEKGTTPELRQKILENVKLTGYSLQDLKYQSYNYAKPEDMRRQDDSQSSQSEDESPKVQTTDGTNGLDFSSTPQYNFGSLNSNAPKSKPHEFNYDQYFHKDIIRKEFMPTGEAHTDV